MHYELYSHKDMCPGSPDCKHEGSLGVTLVHDFTFAAFWRNLGPLLIDHELEYAFDDSGIWWRKK